VADKKGAETPRRIELPEPLARAEAALASPQEPTPAAVHDAIGFVAGHYHEKFAASAVAAHCGLSRFQFSRNFHSTFGITFREYLLRYRIREACRRLGAGEQSVTAIAYGVGFHDGSYFARMFRRYVGVLPSQYARRRDDDLSARD
jgi:AraC-like DNA-binding protein